MPSCSRCGLSYTSGDERCSRCGAELLLNESVEDRYNLSSSEDIVSKRSAQDDLGRMELVADYVPLIQLPTTNGIGNTQLVQKDERKYLLQYLTLPQREEAQSSNHIQIFQEECQFLQKITHVGLPSVSEFFIRDNHLYVLLTYVESKTLLEEIYPDVKSDNPEISSIPPQLPSIDQTIRWARQLANILLFLHTQNPFPIFYRNLDPVSVTVFRGDIQLRDFGVLRSFEIIASSDDQAGIFEFGPFSAPYLTTLQDANHLVDIFSFGRILDFLLTGNIPSSRTDPPAISKNEGSDPRVHQLAKIVMRCCQSVSEEQYKSVSAVISDLDELYQHADFFETEEIVCASCGQINRQSARFCIRCSQLLYPANADVLNGTSNVSIQISYHEDNEQEILQSYQSSKLSPLSIFRLREILDEVQSDSGLDTLLCLDALTEVERMPHQQEAALTVLRQMRGRALLADEVGLGKTIEASMILKELIQRKLVENVLVICPPQLLGQWQMELYEKFDELFLVMGRDIDTSLAWHCPRLIAPYPIIEQRFHSEAMLHHQYDLIILDEVHYLNEPVNWRVLRVIQNLRKKYFLLLSATPMHNDLQELYNIITLLRPGHFEDWDRFSKKFVVERRRVDKEDFGDDELVTRLLDVKVIKKEKDDPNYVHFNDDLQNDKQLKEALNSVTDGDEINQVLKAWRKAQRITVGVKDAGELHTFLKQVMVRNIRSAVAKDYPFPERVAYRRELEMLPEATSFYNRFRVFYQQGVRHVQNRRFLYQMGEIIERMSSSPAAFRESIHQSQQQIRRQLGEKFVTGLREFAAEYPHELVQPKIQATFRYTQEYINKGHKVLIFSQFNETTRYIYQEALRTDLRDYCFIYDETAHPQDKLRSLRDFHQARSGVLFCPGEASEGLNLQFANVMINFDLPWDPMRIEQRIGRIQRIGGYEKVFIINLVLKGTIEEEILRILELKIHMFEAVVGKVEEIIGNLSDADDFRVMIGNLYLERDEENEEGEILKPEERIAVAIHQAEKRSSKEERENVLNSVFLDFTDEDDDDEW